MSGPDEEQLAAWMSDTRRVAFKRRIWPDVRRLGMLSAGLLLAGGIADLLDCPPALAAVCWVAGVVAGTAMLVWFLDPRRFKARPPGPF